MPLRSYNCASFVLALMLSLTLAAVACKTATGEPADGLFKQAGMQRVTVVRVIDGDTVELENGKRVSVNYLPIGLAKFF